MAETNVLNSRLGTFPEDFKVLLGQGCENASSMESLAKQGHFYSHVRLTKPVTTCFYCGFTVTGSTH